MAVPHFAYPFISLSYFHSLAIANNAVLNIHVQVLCEYMFSIILGLYSGVELRGHMAILCLTY